jgi:hypothetical protein
MTPEWEGVYGSGDAAQLCLPTGISITSPTGGGTALLIDIPLEGERGPVSPEP